MSQDFGVFSFANKGLASARTTYTDNFLQELGGNQAPGSSQASESEIPTQSLLEDKPSATIEAADFSFYDDKTTQQPAPQASTVASSSKTPSRANAFTPAFTKIVKPPMTTDRMDIATPYTAARPAAGLQTPHSGSSTPGSFLRVAKMLRTPTHTDPFYEAPSRESRVGQENWITVFGFPPAKASYILKQFAHYGEILNHKVGNGNWMHVLYKEKFQAQKALSKNGKVFDSLYMIGVVECIDTSVLEKEYKPASTTGITPARSKRKVELGRKRPREHASGFDPDALLASAEKKQKPMPEKSLWSRVLDKVFGF